MISVKTCILASKLKKPQLCAVCGRKSRRGTLLKLTCAAQETQESASLIPVLKPLYFPRSQRSYGQKKNIYTFWGRKRFLLPVTYFPTNQVLKSKLGRRFSN